MSKWLLIDGFNLAYRCHFAIPDLTRSDGHPTGALHGWVKTIWKLQDQEHPEAMLVFFDLGGAQDRLSLHPEYKAQREEMPEALERQIEPLKELTRHLGLVGVEERGVESDDLLASKAVALAAQGHEVLIVSSDKDFAQIVSDKIKILLPPPSANPRLGWRLMDASGVLDKFGVPPAQIADYLALVGDSADNIPGLRGVGPKTAVKWLQAYGSLEGIIAAAASVEPARFRESLLAEVERLRLNLKLVTLNLSLAASIPDRGAVQLSDLLHLLQSMEMRSAYGEALRRYEQRELF